MKKVFRIIDRDEEQKPDLEYWKQVSPEEKLSIVQILWEQYIKLFNKQFKFVYIGITLDDLKSDNKIIQLWISPVRIDIITNIDGVKFPEAVKNKVRMKFGNTYTFFIAKEDLIKNKKITRRNKDKNDLDNLLKTK